MVKHATAELDMIRAEFGISLIRFGIKRCAKEPYVLSPDVFADIFAIHAIVTQAYETFDNHTLW